MKLLLRQTLPLVVLILGCAPQVAPPVAATYDFPTPVDTQTRPIVMQEKRKYIFRSPQVTIDNLFDGARLNSALAENDSVIRLFTLPENTPINPSPWYAFRIASERSQRVYLRLSYGKYKHRYSPKFSADLASWTPIDAKTLLFNHDSTEVLFPVQASIRPLFVAAQEVVSTRMVQDWCKATARHTDVDVGIVGRSAGKRPLLMLDIGRGEKKDKPAVVVLSRQHPPEVTGYFAMQHFVDRLLGNDSLATAFRSRYRVLVFPLLNPDGVDQGHWRHNNGGIDLNRDWAVYRQPETRQIADRIVAETNRNSNNVIAGFDFHSTWYDVYYTNVETDKLTLPDFKNRWLRYIEAHIPNYAIDERPSRVGQPVSKGWFYTQFHAVGVTYEIGDATSRDFIQQKGRVSAEGMMRLLLDTP